MLIILVIEVPIFRPRFVEADRDLRRRSFGRVRLGRRQRPRSASQQASPGTSHPLLQQISGTESGVQPRSVQPMRPPLKSHLYLQTDLRAVAVAKWLE